MWGVVIVWPRTARPDGNRWSGLVRLVLSAQKFIDEEVYVFTVRTSVAIHVGGQDRQGGAGETQQCLHKTGQVVEVNSSAPIHVSPQTRADTQNVVRRRN